MKILEQPTIHTLDITGGAPEMNPLFKELVLEARKFDVTIIDRCNLTILLEPGYEDMAQFDKLFPRDPSEARLRAPNIIPLMTQMAREAEASTLQGVRREWMLRDLSHLRDELRRPEDEWRSDVILRDLDWLEGLLDGDEGAELPSLDKLKTTLKAWLT